MVAGAQQSHKGQTRRARSHWHSGTFSFYRWNKLFTKAQQSKHPDPGDIPVNVCGALQKQRPSWSGQGRCLTEGRCPCLIFIPEGIKVNKEVFLDMVRDEVLPWIQDNWFQFYLPTGLSACDGSKVIQGFCKVKFPDFWSKFMWPPSSPVLWTTPYSQARACATPHKNINVLKASLVKEWHSISEDTVCLCRMQQLPLQS